MSPEILPVSLSDRHDFSSAGELYQRPPEIVYDLWVRDPATGNRAWIATTVSRARATSRCGLMRKRCPRHSSHCRRLPAPQFRSANSI